MCVTLFIAADNGMKNVYRK